MEAASPRTPPVRPRHAAVGVLLVAVIYFYPLLLRVPLIDPDEGLHAAIAQEMIEHGDYVTPRLLGQPFLDKPILFFWAQAGSMQLLGMNEAGVRFPGLMFALLGNLTTALLGWRMFGRRVGLLAGLFHLTLALPLVLGQAPVHDVALIPWTNLALLSLWEATRERPAGGAWFQYALAGVWLGLAVLAKGLIGVAIVGVAFGVYLLVSRRLGVRTCLGLLLTLAVGALLASPWYVLMEQRNPGYAYYYFVERHVYGYATATQRHGERPFWYYLPILAAGGLPWIALLPVSVRNLWQNRHDPATRPDAPRVLCWALLLGGLVFLSAAKSKMLTYLLPVFPAVAVLSAEVWAGFQVGTLAPGCRRMISRVVWLAGPVLALLGPAALLACEAEYDFRFPAGTWVLCCAVSAAFLAALWPCSRGRTQGAVAALLLTGVGLFAFLMTAVMPRVAATNSARDLAAHLNRQGRLPAHVVLLNERVGSLIFYLDPDLRAGLRQDQFRNASVEQLVSMGLPPGDLLVAVPERRVAQAGRVLDLSRPSYQRAGQFRLYAGTDLEPKTGFR